MPTPEQERDALLIAIQDARRALENALRGVAIQGVDHVALAYAKLQQAVELVSPPPGCDAPGCDAVAVFILEGELPGPRAHACGVHLAGMVGDRQRVRPILRLPERAFQEQELQTEQRPGAEGHPRR